MIYSPNKYISILATVSSSSFHHHLYQLITTDCCNGSVDNVMRVISWPTLLSVQCTVHWDSKYTGQDMLHSLSPHPVVHQGHYSWQHHVGQLVHVCKTKQSHVQQLHITFSNNNCLMALYLGQPVSWHQNSQKN